MNEPYLARKGGELLIAHIDLLYWREGEYKLPFMGWDGSHAAERSFATGLDSKTPIRRSQSDERAEFMTVAMGAKAWVTLESKAGDEE